MQYLFPASRTFRALWQLTPPESYKKADSDYVRYHAVSVEGDKPTTNPSHKSSACYASCRRPGFDKYDITCIPLQKKGVVDLIEAFEFFNALTNVGVIPEGINLWGEKDGVHCHIPAGIGNPHNIYASLVAYRLIDSCPPLVWEFLKIMDQRGERHPLQILPYLIGKYSIGGGHSFINVDTYGSGTIGKANNPLLGLAAKIYFDQTDERGRKSYENHSMHVNAGIAELAKELTPTIILKSGEENWAAKVDTPKFIFEKTEDGLHPALYEMYAIPNITQKQIGEFLAEQFTKEKK